MYGIQHFCGNVAFAKDTAGSAPQTVRSPLRRSNPLDLLKKELEKLISGIVAIQRELDGYTADAALVEQHLTQTFDLLEDCHQLYLAAPDRHSTKSSSSVSSSIRAADDESRPIIPPPALQTSLRAGRAARAARVGKSTPSINSAANSYGGRHSTHNQDARPHCGRASSIQFRC